MRTLPPHIDSDCAAMHAPPNAIANDMAGKAIIQLDFDRYATPLDISTTQEIAP